MCTVPNLSAVLRSDVRLHVFVVVHPPLDLRLVELPLLGGVEVPDERVQREAEQLQHAAQPLPRLLPGHRTHDTAGTVF